MAAPDPRFLGGAQGVVITDSRQMALTLTIDHDGAADIHCHVSKAQAAEWLGYLAAKFAADAEAEDITFTAGE